VTRTEANNLTRPERLQYPSNRKNRYESITADPATNSTECTYFGTDRYVRFAAGTRIAVIVAAATIRVLVSSI